MSKHIKLLVSLVLMIFRKPNSIIHFSCLLTFILMSFVLSPSVNALEQDFWRDVSVQNKNILKPHAALSELRSHERTAGKILKQNLAGLWSFLWLPSQDQVPGDFYHVGYTTESWSEMPVPGVWDLNGYGEPAYFHNACAYQNSLQQPHLPETTPVGLYKKTLNIPAGWEGRPIALSFESIASAVHVWVNGRSVGYSKGSRLPVEFDLTHYLSTGENDLTLQVYRWSSASLFECHDRWHYSGLIGDVFLIAKPPVHIRDFSTNLTLDENYLHGMMHLKVDVNNVSGREANNYQLKIRLTDDLGKSVVDRAIPIKMIRKSSSREVSVKLRAHNAKLWSAESPYLYDLSMVLMQDGKDVEQLSTKVGFRSAEVKKGRFRINGKPIMIKGVVYNPHHASAGPIIPEKIYENDIQQMKRLNINAVRLRGGVIDPHFYTLANRYGLYIVNELNVDSRGFGAANRRTRYNADTHVINRETMEANYRDRLSRLYARDKNHPAIIAWSFGDESGDGAHSRSIYDAFKVLSDAPFIVEQAQGRTHTDILGLKYPSLSSLRRLHDLASEKRPLISMEFASAAGNGLGGLHQYWQEARAYPFFQGGFISEWIDQTFSRQTRQGEPFSAYGQGLMAETMKSLGENIIEQRAIQGVVSSLRHLKPLSKTIKKTYQPIKIDLIDKKKGQIKITNRHFFVSTENLYLSWELMANGKIISHQDNIPMNLQPRESDFFRLAYDYQSSTKKEHFLKVEVRYRESGNYWEAKDLMAWRQFALDEHIPGVVLDATKKLSYTKKASSYRIRGENFSAVFDEENGLFQSLRYGNLPIFDIPPAPDFWRLPTDIDQSLGLDEASRVWQHVGKQRQLTAFNFEEYSSHHFEIQTQHYLPSIDSHYLTTYSILGSGEISVTYAMEANPSRQRPELPRFGQVFSLNKALNQVQWYGLGPEENYWDRSEASTMGMFEKRLDRSARAYSRYQESGYHTQVRHVKFVDGKGFGVAFLGDPTIAFSASAYTRIAHRAGNNDQISNQKKTKSTNAYPSQQGLYSGVPSRYVHANIDLQQRGLGGVNSGESGASHLGSMCEFDVSPAADKRLPWMDYSYRFTIRPVYPEN